MKRFIAIFSVLFFVQFLNVAWCADSDPVLEGKVATTVDAMAVEAVTVTTTGTISVDDTTDSASTTTGSIHTDGGLGVVKKSFFGDDADFGGIVSVSGSHSAESYTAESTSAPAVSFVDSDQLDTTDSETTGKIYNNITTTTDNATIGDMYFQTTGAQGTAGTLETFMQMDGSAKTLVTNVFQAGKTSVGLTADTGSSQGDGVIVSTYNVYTTVGTAGDAATLPATAIVGTIIVIKNDAAANAMDVFPASGDDLGEGADTALSIPAGNGAMFLCTVADSTWTNILEGI